MIIGPFDEIAALPLHEPDPYPVHNPMCAIVRGMSCSCVPQVETYRATHCQFDGARLMLGMTTEGYPPEPVYGSYCPVCTHEMDW